MFIQLRGSLIFSVSHLYLQFKIWVISYIKYVKQLTLYWMLIFHFNKIVCEWCMFLDWFWQDIHNHRWCWTLRWQGLNSKIIIIHLWVLWEGQWANLVLIPTKIWKTYILLSTRWHLNYTLNFNLWHINSLQTTDQG